MADRSVRVVLSAVTTGFSAGMTKASGEAKKLSEHLNANRQAADTLATGMMLAGGAALAGVGMAAKAYGDFDKAMSAVKATGADARDNMKALSDAALKAGADTKYSATEAAAGVENLLKAGVSAKDVLGGGLTGALSLAAAGELDVADAAETAATAMTQFKLKGTDVGHVADLLAAGAGKAQGEVSDMAMALKQGGLVASQFGLSIEETVGGLSAFASAGLIGSDAGTSLKAMLIALANPAGKTAQAMAELGINAYDAQGKFIGLEGLAGVLQERLGGLTDAQRQQALAQIFGNDAIRAAAILYDQGSEGIANWTKQVDEAGYAGQVAATRMDNLAGDIEQLGGSWETAMIKMGASANGPLRGATQALTGLVNAAADAPPELQSMAMFAGTAFGATSLLAGGAIKLKGSLEAAGLASNFLGNSLGSITAKAGLVGVALTVAGMALGDYLAKQATHKADVEALTAAIEGQTDAVNQQSRAYIANKLQKDGALAAAEKLGVSTKAVVDATMGDSAAQSEVATRLAQVRDARKAAMDAAYAQTGSLDAYNTALTDTEQAEIDLSRAMGDSTKAFTDAKDATRQKAEATGDAAKADGDATGAAFTLAGQTKKLADEQARAAQEALAHADKLRELASLELQLSGSAIGLEAAIDAATDAAKENGKTLDINTEAGRANRGALDGIAAASLALQESQIKAGESTEAITASTQRARDSFIQAAEKMGMSKVKAQELADAYGLIPGKVHTEVTATIQQPDLSAWHARLQARVNANPLYVPSYTSSPIARAGGGAVHGPGTATSDSILARLSNGEFVIKASSAAAIGMHRLDYINRYGRLPAFADGGRVHYASAPPRYATGGPVATSASVASGHHVQVTNHNYYPVSEPSSVVTNRALEKAAVLMGV